MDDLELKLLLNKKAIILPDDIDHDLYRMIAEAALMFPDDTIDLYCRGDGGSSRSALAIVDVIREHGKFVGLLPGEANSSHATIWAGCSERYVYPHGAIGMHKIIWEATEIILTAQIMDAIGDDYEKAERQVSVLFASVSNHDADFWQQAQDYGNIPYKMKMFYAQELIEMGMALPIADRPKLVLNKDGGLARTLDGRPVEKAMFLGS